MGLIVGLGMALSVKSCYPSIKTSSDYQNQNQNKTKKLASHACNQPQCWKLWDKNRWVLKLINQTALPNQISGIVESHQKGHPTSHLHIHIHMNKPTTSSVCTPQTQHKISHTQQQQGTMITILSLFCRQGNWSKQSWIILAQGFCLAPGFKTRYTGHLSKLRCP